MSYVEGNLVPGETVIYQTRLHWIVMLGHYALGCLLFGLPGVLLFYYAFSQAGIESKTLHLMEGGGAALLACGVATILDVTLLVLIRLAVAPIPVLRLLLCVRL